MTVASRVTTSGMTAPPAPPVNQRADSGTDPRREHSGGPGTAFDEIVPMVVLVTLLALWTALGLRFALGAPFGSGTDESIRYAAFAAAKNRWATEADFHRHGIDHFYYPPLYFLAFAPFWGDEPSFVEGYPQTELDPNYLNLAGRRVVSEGYPSRVPPPLLRLYRQARLFSLGLGLVVLLALAATLRLLFPCPSGWWVVLLGATPLVLLPQFLYYHTLANNDTLLNALGAVATCAFTAAVLALERGSERRFFALGLVAAACVGLALLTKMSAPVLLPLVIGLAWARFRADRLLDRATRVKRTILLLGLLAVVVVLAGGWWIGYKALLGDWNSFKAHRLAHPWALAKPEWAARPGWWLGQIVVIARTYYALFSGNLLIGVPDAIFLAWLALPLALAVCVDICVVSRARNRGAPVTTTPATGLRAVVWGTFAGVVLLNAGSILVNLAFFRAAFGRLLFPSAVALHAVAAAVVVRALRGRPRAVAGAALLLVAHSGLLFGWTCLNVLAPAVLQPPEDVRILSGAASNMEYGPVWRRAAEQDLRLPPGNLTALRVAILRTPRLPQAGAALEGVLTLTPSSGMRRQVRVRRTALGQTGFDAAWTELALEQPVRLDAETGAVLSLRGSPPALFPGLVEFKYQCANRAAPARWDGALKPCAPCVAAVYR